jgi:hypothetical protein
MFLQDVSLSVPNYTIWHTRRCHYIYPTVQKKFLLISEQSENYRRALYWLQFHDKKLICETGVKKGKFRKKNNSQPTLQKGASTNMQYKSS